MFRTSEVCAHPFLDAKVSSNLSREPNLENAHKLMCWCWSIIDNMQIEKDENETSHLHDLNPNHADSCQGTSILLSLFSSTSGIWLQLSRVELSQILSAESLDETSKIYVFVDTLRHEIHARGFAKLRFDSVSVTQLRAKLLKLSRWFFGLPLSIKSRCALPTEQRQGENIGFLNEVPQVYGVYVYY
jgi:hypothetical protein